MAELEKARQVAEAAKNGSAMAMATMGKAKILGLIIDRRETGDVGAFEQDDGRGVAGGCPQKSAEGQLGLPSTPENVVPFPVSQKGG